MGSVLAHHGVKGMKWGSRKSSVPKGTATINPASSDHLRVEGHKAVIKNGGVKALSNHQLQEVVTRLNLEQQHRNLQGNAVDKGHSHVQKVLKVVKTLKEIDGMAGRPVGKAIGKAAAKAAKTVVKTAVGA